MKIAEARCGVLEFCILHFSFRIQKTCHSCEDFIHKTWTHNELRDEFNTVEKIRSDPRFQKFLRWLYKQQEGTFFRTRRNRSRPSQPYR